MKTSCHVKLKFFLWTKLLENLLLAKYLIPVAETSNVSISRPISEINLETMKVTIYEVSYLQFQRFSKKYDETTFDVFWKRYFKVSLQ